MTFTEALIYGLACKDMSRRELAKQSGISASTVTNWLLKKKTPRLDLVEAVALLLDLKMLRAGQWEVGT